MASIGGLVSQNGKIEFNAAKLVGKMLNRMRHRGPDNQTIRTLPNGRGAFGSNEINLTTKTTLSSSLAQVPYILFDGELFNERQDGQTDISLFDEYYKKYEKDAFSRLNGFFSCAIIEKNEEVILIRDHVGPRPLFYGYNKGNLYFSSEMKGLKDKVSFNIAELPPGHMYSSKDGLKPFDPYIAETPEISDIPQTAAALRDMLIDAVKIRMEGVEAIALSGGLDSSIIATIAKEFNPNIKLFTGVVEKKPGPDLENAKFMADFLGLEHHIYTITYDDIRNFLSDSIWYLESFDEDCISGILSNYYVSKLVKGYSDIVMVGEGADELFGGYRMVLKNPRVKSEEEREKLAQKLLDIAYNTALRRLDRGWLANSVNYQTPFLDTRIVAFSQKIPMKWKIYGEKQIEKYILREAFRGMLPDRIVDREKLRFAMGTGMDSVMDEIISEIIDPKELQKRPKAAYGLPFSSFKEVYYYDEFLKLFPPSYEGQTIRWDPFK